jgi:hypothetical protein
MARKNIVTEPPNPSNGDAEFPFGANADGDVARIAHLAPIKIRYRDKAASWASTARTPNRRDPLVGSRSGSTCVHDAC